jgi:hypothetical protein
MLDNQNKECVCNNQLILDGNIDIYEKKEYLSKWINEINDYIFNK